MTERADLTDLISRIEAAECGSRELDAEIFRHIDPDAMENDDGTFESPLFDRVAMYPPRYTTSLDAALSLVPEGWGTDCAGQTVDSWGWSLANDLRSPRVLRRTVSARAPTPALALCLASLRARNGPSTT